MVFVGDDGSEEHHDIEVQDGTGRVLARARLPEGVAGIDRLHTLIASHAADNSDLDDVDLEVAGGDGDRTGTVGAGFGGLGVSGARL